MKFIDLFSGIGGFRLGMEMAGHECVGHVEKDKFANKSYEAIFGGGDLIGEDIRKITNEQWREYRGKVDCLCGGFPCQDFSIAGNRRGFENTRGTLFFEILRAAKEIQPSYLFLENVKGLLSHEQGETFKTMLTALDECGYDARWQVLNSEKFGVPQNRERVFIIGYLRGRCTRKVLPFTREGEEVAATNKIKIIGKTGKSQKDIVYSTDGIVGALIATDYKQPKPIKLGNVNPSQKGMNGDVYSINAPGPTLTTNKGEGQKIVIPVLTPDRIEKRQNGRRFKENGDPSFTLTAQDRHGVIMQVGRGFNKGGVFEVCPTLSKSSWENNNFLKEKRRARRLTPREYWRLQAFPDTTFDAAREVNSDSQLYKQAGNGVTVNVVYEIARRLEVIE